MPSELVMAVVTALTTKGADALVTGGKDGLVALFRLVRSRLMGEGRSEVAVLEAACEHPDDPVRRRQLVDVLTHLVERDATFRERLSAHVQDAKLEIHGGHGSVVNHFSGSAEKVVQARDVLGDITL